MTILKTFSEFVRDIAAEFPVFPGERCCKNLTTQPHAGHSEVLYEAQFEWFTVAYSLRKLWAVTFNGASGEGATLPDAVAAMESDSRAKWAEHEQRQAENAPLGA